MKTIKPKREPIPADEVLEWLLENAPNLHAVAEMDRAWIWLPVDLRQQPELRKLILKFGFIYASRGHPLPSGNIGTYGHSCDVPTGFKRRGKSRGASRPADNAVEPTEEQTNPTEEQSVDLQELAAAFL